MRFLYLAIHYPGPSHAEDLLLAMKKLGQAMHAADGLIEATAWLEQDGTRIVATSIWESSKAFQQARRIIGETIRDVPFEEWEARPRELFQLNEIS